MGLEEMRGQEDFIEALEDYKSMLSEKSDSGLLEIAIAQGKDLDDVSEYFPAYEVALKIKKNGWKPTSKQRQAIINVTAYYLANGYEEE